LNLMTLARIPLFSLINPCLGEFPIMVVMTFGVAGLQTPSRVVSGRIKIKSLADLNNVHTPDHY
ncbi:MAG: hypothetical protein D0530_06520, partial [Methylococcales bacterium]